MRAVSRTPSSNNGVRSTDSPRAVAPLAGLGERPAFQLLEEIGSGGVGVVYRARQTSLDREVALKRVGADAGEGEVLDRFLTESAITGRLQHPNIVPVYDLDRSVEGVSLVMKLVEGRSWGELLRGRHESDLPRQLSILVQVCHAVAYAHSQGVVHNDLKPDNVMIGEFGEVLVVDWGLAVELDRSRSAPAGSVTAPCGTPAYMAPELAEGRGEDLDPRTDVYLLGGILCELLTGRAPHAGMGFWQAVVHASEGRLPDFDPDLPEELVGMCRRALSANPAERQSSAQVFREELEAYLRHRESWNVSKRAWERLKAARARSDGGSGGQGPDADRVYEGFVEASVGFRQALELWQGNQSARDGEEEACRTHAAAALRQGDLGLARSLAWRLPDSEDAAALRQRVEQAEDSRRHERRSRARLKKGLAGASVLVVMLLACLLVYHWLARIDLERRAAHTAVRGREAIRGLEALSWMLAYQRAAEGTSSALLTGVCESCAVNRAFKIRRQGTVCEV